MKRITFTLLSLLVAAGACDRAPTRQPGPPVAGAAPSAVAKTGYAPIGPLKMYYEVHGTGRPVLLIHGGVSEIQTSFGSILPYLAKQRQVIAIEEQGHGHTADVDRPLTFEQMADDAAALLRHLRIENTDVVGYSDGGNVALALAIRHPAMVRKVVVASTNYNNDGLDPKVRQGIEQSATMSESEVVKGVPPQFAKAYADVAPQPEKWQSLVSKVMKQGAAFKGWTPEQIRSITAPTLIVLADRDIATPEHAVAMFRLHRTANLAIVPGREHFSIVDRPEVLNPMLVDFLEAPMPSAASTK